MRQYDVGTEGERVGLDAAQSAIAIDARHPGLTGMLMEADKTDDIGIGDKKNKNKGFIEYTSTRHRVPAHTRDSQD